MKKLRLIAVTVLIAGLAIAFAGCGGSAGGDGEGADPQATEAADAPVSFETTDLAGNAVKSEELFAENEVTMINLWGTFCGPCIKEMPEVEKIYEEYGEKGVAVMGIVVDVTAEDDSCLQDANEIISATGVTYLNLKSWDGLMEQMPAPGVPTTYFVDREGNKVAEPVVGADIEGYRSTLDQLLK